MEGVLSRGIGSGNFGANSSIVISAGSNAVLFDRDNFLTDGQSRDVGSQINAQGNLRLAAGNDLNAKAANVQAGGALTATAGNSVNITAGQSTSSFSWGMTTSESDLFSATSTKERKTSEQANAVGSSFGGNTVTIASGQDINVKGSSVISDTGTTLAAGRNLTLEAAQNTQSSSSFYEKKESGLLDGGGAGITIGSREQSTDQKNRSTSAAASTVGSIGGNVTLIAGEQYRQVGSDVLAPNGDITIVAKKVDIVEARETSRTDIEQKFKQTGLTLEVTSPVISALQTIDQMSQAASNTSDGRMQALAAANGALAARNSLKAIEAGQGSFMNGKEGQIATGGQNPDGSPASRDATDADKAGGINLAVSIGGSSSQSLQQSQSDIARGSIITAGNNITIAATGAGQDSNLTIQGSNVEAGRAVQLLADNQVKLLAAQNTASQNSTNNSSSGSLGFSVGTDGFMVNASASKGRGKADGSDTSYTNTGIQGGDQVSISSGGDTTLQGAVIRAEQVKATIGGNLNVESLQDTSTYASSQQSIGGSLSVGYGKMSGSISASNSNINSDFRSVAEQSGIKAGDGGFQVNVAGNTSMNGSVIASTDKAVTDGKNSFSTGGTLTTTDIQNVASYKGQKTSIGLGAGYQGSTVGLNGMGVGIGKTEGNARSITTSGISGIAGNTAVRSTDAETGLSPIFDAARVQREIDAQAAISQYFNQQAPKEVADFASSKVDELKAKIEKESDRQRKTELQEELKKWSGPGSYVSAMNIIVAALGGGITGAMSSVSKESLAWAADEMRQAMIEDSKKFPGICDAQGNCLDNQSGKSAGVNGDNFKLAGGRVDLDLICGADNKRCATVKDINNSDVLDLNTDGTVRFIGGDLKKLLDDNPQWRSPMGGWQGAAGQLKPLGDYVPGSFPDKLAEAYSGTHDTFNSSTWYGPDGTTKRGMSEAEKSFGELLNKANVLLATPFGLATLLPPEVWNAILIGLKASH